MGNPVVLNKTNADYLYQPGKAWEGTGSDSLSLYPELVVDGCRWFWNAMWVARRFLRTVCDQRRADMV